MNSVLAMFNIGGILLKELIFHSHATYCRVKFLKSAIRHLRLCVCVSVRLASKQAIHIEFSFYQRTSLATVLRNKAVRSQLAVKAWKPNTCSPPPSSATSGPAGAIPAAPAPSAPTVANPAGWTCGAKSTSGPMMSGEEATFYLTQCGVKRLDGDGDGVPCASLCR